MEGKKRGRPRKVSAEKEELEAVTRVLVSTVSHLHDYEVRFMLRHLTEPQVGRLIMRIWELTNERRATA